MVSGMGGCAGIPHTHTHTTHSHHTLTLSHIHTHTLSLSLSFTHTSPPSERTLFHEPLDVAIALSVVQRAELGGPLLVRALGGVDTLAASLTLGANDLAHLVVGGREREREREREWEDGDVCASWPSRRPVVPPSLPQRPAGPSPSPSSFCPSHAPRRSAARGAPLAQTGRTDLG
jgi:hypothetical protein